MANIKQAHNPVESNPQGHLLAGGISFSKLSPLAGKLAQKGHPTCCGWITGIVMATLREPGTEYGPYTRFVGDFLAIRHPTREEVAASELYLPAMAERFLQAAFDNHGAGVPVRFEVWAIPDANPKNQLGWKYAVYLRQPPGAISEARRLAIESGIIDPPAAPPAQALEGPQGLYDPETGEVMPDAAA